MLGGLGLMGGGGDAEAFHVLVELSRIALRNQRSRNPLLIGPVDDLVIDVGDISDIVDLVTPKLQVAIDDIEDDGGPAVADVATVVNGDPTNVHSDLARVKGLKILFLLSKRIVNAQGHSMLRTASRKPFA